ncbi:MAG: hypothetical protein EOO41_05800, partial [Methanobacteriota archaeon]
MLLTCASWEELLQPVTHLSGERSEPTARGAGTPQMPIIFTLYREVSRILALSTDTLVLPPIVDITARSHVPEGVPSLLPVCELSASESATTMTLMRIARAQHSALLQASALHFLTLFTLSQPAPIVMTFTGVMHGSSFAKSTDGSGGTPRSSVGRDGKVGLASTAHESDASSPAKRRAVARDADLNAAPSPYAVTPAKSSAGPLPNSSSNLG